jgi:hypothetical protein
VLLALSELLGERGERYAILDLDWLAWCRSDLTPSEMLSANLRAVWTNFRHAGVRRLVLARHVRSPAELAPIAAALPDVPLVAIRLEAPRRVLEERVRARDRGAALDEHLALIAEAEAAERFEDAAVRADLASPREVALAVLAAAGWDRT